MTERTRNLLFLPLATIIVVAIIAYTALTVFAQDRSDGEITSWR